MKKYLKLHWSLWILLLLSLYAIAAIDFDLDWRIPEAFRGGHKPQNFFYQLSIGYIVSLVFYYVVVFIAEIKTKETFKIFLNHQLKAYYLKIHSVIIALNLNSGKQSNFQLPTNEELEKLFQNLTSTHPGNLFSGRQITIWQEIMELYPYYNNMILSISIRSKITDSELDSKLDKLDNCGLFFHIKYSGNFAGINMGMIGISFISFLDELKEISRYCNSKYKTDEFVQFINSKSKTV